MEYVDFWSVESALYAKLDAEMMRGETSYSKEFSLGNNQIFSISISSKAGSPISLNQTFSTKEVDFKIDFRAGSSTSLPNWFRLDNQGGHGSLHFHLESGTQQFNEHIPFPENKNISEVISLGFQEAEKVMKRKYPDFPIRNNVEFTGSA
ncbi:MAG: hypothetical protein Q7R87_04290 [Nanoarchaeota archaeon]|nr:hypothetical protein [Nanoarchaeota archaeon]